MDQTAYFEQMRQKRRAEILEEARQMILAEGPMTFTMQNLSKRLDISNVTLYKYFKNSEDLLRTLYLETSQKYGGYSGSRISEETPLEAFLQNIRFSLDEYLECRKDMALLTTLSLFGRTFAKPRKISSAKRSVRRRSLCSRKRSARGRSATIFRLRKSSDF